jgi:hypothetical protein
MELKKKQIKRKKAAHVVLSSLSLTDFPGHHSFSDIFSSRDIFSSHKWDVKNEVTL